MNEAATVTRSTRNSLAKASRSAKKIAREASLEAWRQAETKKTADDPANIAVWIDQLVKALAAAAYGMVDCLNPTASDIHLRRAYEMARGLTAKCGTARSDLLTESVRAIAAEVEAAQKEHVAAETQQRCSGYAEALWPLIWLAGGDHSVVAGWPVYMTKAPDRVPVCPIAAASQELARALDDAARTEETQSWSGESDRILRTAHEMAVEMITAPTGHEDNTPGNRAYTIAALIKAALQVPGDTPSAERLTFIEQTRAPLVGLTGDPKVLDGWETSPGDTATTSEPEPARSRDWLPDTLAKVREAAAILSVTVDKGSTDQVSGLARLADWTAEKVRARVDGVDDSETPCSDSACDIACLMALLNLVTEQDDDVLLYAAASILEVAASLCRSAQEAGHA